MFNSLDYTPPPTPDNACPTRPRPKQGMNRSDSRKYFSSKTLYFVGQANEVILPNSQTSLYACSPPPLTHPTPDMHKGHPVRD